MTTIEERYGNPQEPYCFETDREEQWYKCGQVNGATEQDSISRQEERSRCIKATQVWYCKHLCGLYKNCKCELAEAFSQAGCDCFTHSEIRKVIEEGGNV